MGDVCDSFVMNGFGSSKMFDEDEEEVKGLILPPGIAALQKLWLTPSD
jgi:hypothetical protein